MKVTALLTTKQGFLCWDCSEGGRDGERKVLGVLMTKNKASLADFQVMAGICLVLCNMLFPN